MHPIACIRRTCAAVAVSLIGVAVAGVVTPPEAFAQAASAPASRGEIKAETRAAEKAGKLTPAGEAVTPAVPPGPPSNKTRAQRKAETRAARSAGQLEPAGDAEGAKEVRAELGSKSTRTRAQRKAATLSAAKAHQLQPAGEGPDAPKK